MGKITIQDLGNFLAGNAHYLFGGRLLPPHEQQQVVYRAAKCRDCLEAGKCKVCSCSTPNMFFAPKKTDALKKWGKFMPEKEWEEFTKTREYIEFTKTEDYK